jgi:putative SOS response-associated peptidase YedK
MCGGFALFNDTDFGTRFKIKIDEHVPHYNIRPTHSTPVVYTLEGVRKAKDMRFGMIPVWAKDERIGYKLFNARSETLFEKPAWKRSAKSKRCLIPANGFFEWQKLESRKRPMFIFPRDQELFSFAGVYDHWTNPLNKEEIMSFSIITTTPNKEMKPIHDRMPVIFDEEKEELWLGEDDEPDFLAELLQPYPDGKLDMYEVSSLVNTAKNQGEKIIEKVK